MKFTYSLLLTLFFSGCTSVTTSISNIDDNVIMNSSEESCFSDTKEKLKLSFSPQNGGQILSIYWEGAKVADQFQESYPNEKLNFTQLKPRVIDDGSGLVIVDSNVRGEYQLRRSYSLKYLEDSEEHVIEVIYNVKNYSSETVIDQQWIQSLSLPKSLDIRIEENGATGIDEKMSFQIEAINVKDLVIEGDNSSIKLSNAESFNLGTKERLSWKVLYKLKSVD
ncbi:MAG: hypothetical protein NE328_14975 [Lentisphaeraceae bacterium]|nr:hypothetical protein [Lentisphaeraceae bacterium]